MQGSLKEETGAKILVFATVGCMLWSAIWRHWLRAREERQREREEQEQGNDAGPSSGGLYVSTGPWV
ncbi:hypothetical protein HY375_03850 [Candidatus Berkelbacteria bacterium]|nr:hypothetical protein [Candidatus Berkelbacteria bacterium]